MDDHTDYVVALVAEAWAVATKWLDGVWPGEATVTGLDQFAEWTDG